jgi:2-aminoadipate transaminase
VTTRGGVAGPLSHARFWHSGIVQSLPPVGVLDLGPGYLDPSLLPVDLLKDAYSTAMSEFGSAMLGYGDNRGALPLRAALAARMQETDGQACAPEQVVITAGTSQALHLIATTFAAAGDVVLVDQTSYDLGRRIFADSGLRLREVPADDSGMDPAALDAALGAVGAATAFIYLIPTFHNPTGLVVPIARRQELLTVAAGHKALIVEDDAYAELVLTRGHVPSSLAGLAGYRGVIRLQTFSKSLAPGLRLGWLQAEEKITDRLASLGIFHSGGSPSHTSSLAVLAMLQSGGYSRHLHWLRGQLRARRDALAGALHDSLGNHFDFTPPSGGFFIWLRAGRPHSEAELLAAARRAGVRVASGSQFGHPSQPSLRLAYSFLSPGQLVSAGRQLANALNASCGDADRRAPCDKPGRTIHPLTP